MIKLAASAAVKEDSLHQENNGILCKKVSADAKILWLLTHLGVEEEE